MYICLLSLLELSSLLSWDIYFLPNRSEHINQLRRTIFPQLLCIRSLFNFLDSTYHNTKIPYFYLFSSSLYWILSSGEWMNQYEKYFLKLNWNSCWCSTYESWLATLTNLALEKLYTQLNAFINIHEKKSHNYGWWREKRVIELVKPYPVTYKFFCVRYCRKCCKAKYENTEGLYDKHIATEVVVYR